MRYPQSAINGIRAKVTHWPWPGTCLLFVALALAGALRAQGPDIDIWYGEEQAFGRPALTQRWINILGEVRNPESVKGLSYSLNGGPEIRLSIGPDERRLAQAGDFNADIGIEHLEEGANRVVFTATDEHGGTVVREVTVDYHSGGAIPLGEYSIDWSQLSGLRAAGQVVDGLWAVGSSGLRPVELGYDRVVSVGDRNWADYEAAVPFVIHRAEPRWGSPSHGAALFIVTRWRGHSVWDDSQPAYGWWPLGGSINVLWNKDGSNSLRFVGNKAALMGKPRQERGLEQGVPYIGKIRVETLPGTGSLYSFKVWEASEAEPASWDYRGRQHLWDPLSGSMLLIAHHADISFGPVSVVGLAQTNWERFVIFGGYVAQFPFLLACFAGLLVALKLRGSDPSLAKAVAVATVLMGLVTVAGVVLSFNMPLWLHQAGRDTHTIGVAVFAVEALQSCVLALALGVLLLQFVRRRA